MLNQSIIIPGLLLVGFILYKLLKNEFNIRKKYKDGENKKPFLHPPNKL